MTGRAVLGKVLMHIKSFVLKFYTFWYRSPDRGRQGKGVSHGKTNKIRQILTHFLRRLDQNHVNHTFWCAQNDPHLVCMYMAGFESMTPTHIDATHANIFRNTNFISRNPREFDHFFGQNNRYGRLSQKPILVPKISVRQKSYSDPKFRNLA